MFIIFRGAGFKQHPEMSTSLRYIVQWSHSPIQSILCHIFTLVCPPTTSNLKKKGFQTNPQPPSPPYWRFQNHENTSGLHQFGLVWFTVWRGAVSDSGCQFGRLMPQFLWGKGICVTHGMLGQMRESNHNQDLSCFSLKLHLEILHDDYIR